MDFKNFKLIRNFLRAQDIFFGGVKKPKEQVQAEELLKILDKNEIERICEILKFESFASILDVLVIEEAVVESGGQQKKPYGQFPADLLKILNSLKFLTQK